MTVGVPQVCMEGDEVSCLSFLSVQRDDLLACEPDSLSTHIWIHSVSPTAPLSVSMVNRLVAIFGKADIEVLFDK